MFKEDQLPINSWLVVISRFLFTSLFLISGITHFTDIPYYVGLMPEGVPGAVLLVVLSGVVELAGALMVLFNWRPRLGAWLLVLFLAPVTVLVHGYQMYYAEDEATFLMQQAHFLKGISLVGAALLITQLGASRRVD